MQVIQFAVDLNDIIKSCDDAKKGVPVDSGKVLGDMLGMIVHMFAKQSENDATKKFIPTLIAFHTLKLKLVMLARLPIPEVSPSGNFLSPHMESLSFKTFNTILRK